MGAKYKTKKGEEGPILPHISTENMTKSAMRMQVEIALYAGANVGHAIPALTEDLMAAIKQHVDHQIQENHKNQEEKRNYIGEKKNWHEIPDPMIWAEKFVSMHRNKEVGTDDGRYTRVDEGLMVAWFANAMAAATRPYENAEVTWSAEEGTRVDGEHRPPPTTEEYAGQKIGPMMINKGIPVKDNPQA